MTPQISYVSFLVIKYILGFMREYFLFSLSISFCLYNCLCKIVVFCEKGQQFLIKEISILIVAMNYGPH